MGMELVAALARPAHQQLGSRSTCSLRQAVARQCDSERAAALLTPLPSLSHGEDTDPRTHYQQGPAHFPSHSRARAARLYINTTSEKSSRRRLAPP